MGWYTGYHYLGKRSLNLKEDLKPMLRHGMPFMDTGQHGILDITTSEREVLNLKEDLTPMPICTIPPMDTGHLGIMATTTGVNVRVEDFILTFENQPYDVTTS